MSEPATLIYLEADDEITSVVRRVREADVGRVVVVAPGRSRATSSAVALRLLARIGSAEGRDVVVVGDGLTRSLAAEAGLGGFASVDEARTASFTDGDAAATAEEPRHAAIHVVRRAATDETVAAPTPADAGAPAPTSAGATDETRAVPLPLTGPTRPRPAAAPRIRRPSRGLAVVLGVAAALLVAGVVAGATLLPAATVSIAARPVPFGATYELIVEEPTRHEDSVDASATVAASGTYETVERATGVVTFRNFDNGAVEVPAGTLVAAGRQAFETTEAVTVPSGSLTGDGRIAAGEQVAPVVAAAPGPAANVDAGTIDTVLTQSVAARLRGFPQNNTQLVENAEPTSGGVDQSGPLIIEGDVTAAVEELRAELLRRAEEEMPDVGEMLVVERATGEPRIEVPDDLVGTRDQPEAEISGSLAWRLVIVDPDALEEEARRRLASDPSLPAGHDLLTETVRVELGAPTRDGDAVIVEADVEASTVPRLERDLILGRIVGRTESEAELALADLGEADVQLWPGWVASVPELEWRVELRVRELDR